MLLESVKNTIKGGKRLPILSEAEKKPITLGYKYSLCYKQL